MPCENTNKKESQKHVSRRRENFMPVYVALFLKFSYWLVPVFGTFKEKGTETFWYTIHRMPLTAVLAAEKGKFARALRRL